MTKLTVVFSHTYLSGLFSLTYLRLLKMKTAKDARKSVITME